MWIIIEKEKEILVETILARIWKIKVQALTIKSLIVLENHQSKQVWRIKPQQCQVKIKKIFEHNKGKVITNLKTTEATIECTWS